MIMQTVPMNDDVDHTYEWRSIKIFISKMASALGHKRDYVSLRRALGPLLLPGSNESRSISTSLRHRCRRNY